jgi:hypothetical protein
VKECIDYVSTKNANISNVKTASTSLARKVLSHLMGALNHDCPQSSTHVSQNYAEVRKSTCPLIPFPVVTKG